MILYTFIRCPWAMRARMALAYQGIDYEAREVDLKNKPKELLEVSPKGTVPVLVLPDGRVLEESLDIVLWAMPDTVDDLIKTNDSNFKFNVNRYKYPDRYPEEAKSAEFYRQACEDFIQQLEQQLSQHKYLRSNQVSISDIAIFPLVRQFSKVDEAWFAASRYVNVKRWLADISDSDFFKKAMEK